MSYMPYDSLPDPTDKYELGEEIGEGFHAKVYKAKDLQNNRTVAIKIQPYDEEHGMHIEEEYRVLRDLSTYSNLPEFYGAFRQKCNKQCDKIWFVLQYCEGGSAVSLVNRLLEANRTMKEEHIAFILREAARAAIELHRNHFIHRDIRASNILITKEGEIKLCDFGLTREIDSTFGKRGTCIGSPCWMSPELVTSQDTKISEVYGSRIDVWAFGITAIELADGRPPFFDMHPSRTMFQIVRNPPPTLFKPSNWTQDFVDFIAECLEKNPENRPYMVEIIEHPFLSELPRNDFALQQEIKCLLEIAATKSYKYPEEVSIDRGFIKKYNSAPEKMYVEDLAAIDNPTDDKIVNHIGSRLKLGRSYSFIGDILLSLNSNDMEQDFPEELHSKFKFKSRSENAPHIFAVADLAYQDMMHHKETQHVIFAGESYSGKTTNVRLLIEHLAYLGGGNKGATDRVLNAMKAIAPLTNAGTPINNNSTRCYIQNNITFGSTGKLSGAVFLTHLIEKTRVSTTDMNQHNFHIFYYFYDHMDNNGSLAEYLLSAGRSYRYLRIPTEKQTLKLTYTRDDPKENVQRYKDFEKILNDMDFSEKDVQTIRKTLAAILNLGNVRFKQGSNRFAEFEEMGSVTKVADLLRLDEKKFQWALVNYCKIKGGIAERRQYTAEEARDARDALAATLYQRLVDWVINKMNQNLAFPRAVFGDVNNIIAYDMFGFECFHRNGLEQLMINTFNEQMQYHYNQKIFSSEMMEQDMDGIPPVTLNFYDNKQTLDHLLTKPEGLFCVIEEATKGSQDNEPIMDKVIKKKSQYIKSHSNHEISVAHFTGKIVYDTRAFVDSNRDFVPPEMIESLRTSLDENVVVMFTNQLTKCGNLTMQFERGETKKKNYEMNTLSCGQYNQLAQLRTLSAVFRATCLDTLKTVTARSQSSGSHFVRCIRANLDYKPRTFHEDMVLQQLKALSVLDTVIARQQGYSCRISYNEFLKRYQFLAFDFDETVDVTKDNCRLLLIRLKMEGWAIGKSKVFLRYYNDEFLSRLYETQVKKIIKVQSMMRAYISRRKTAQKAAGQIPSKQTTSTTNQTPEEAAVSIQKAFRGFQTRRKYGPLLNESSGQIDQATVEFVKPFARRWRCRSMFQVILHYRAARFQDLVNLSQQVHLYNQVVITGLIHTAKAILLDNVDSHQSNPAAFGSLPPPLRKIPFRLDEIPYFDTSYMCDPVYSYVIKNTSKDEVEEEWDAPLRAAPSLTSHLMTYNAYKKEQSCQTNWDKACDSDVVPNQSYSRDPNMMTRNNQLNRINTDYTSRQVSGSDSNYMRKSNHQADYSSKYTPASFQSTGTGTGGSRRNSLYNKRMAPTPPPMNHPRAENTWTPRPTSNSNLIKNDNRPPNPIQELQMMGRQRQNDNDSSDDPPFNFKAMLRKTNYSRPENNNNDYSRNGNAVYSSKGNDNSSYSRSGEKSTFDQKPNRDRQDFNFNNRAEESNDNRGSGQEPRNSSVEKDGTYIEEEIAPGVKLSGYAYNI